MFYPFQIHWSKLGPDFSTVSDIVSDDKYTIHSNGSLSILDAEKEDEGNYTIEISNNVGTAKAWLEVGIISKTSK